MNGDLDGVRRCKDIQVFISRTSVEKADIIIAIRRRKSPSTASGFTSIENLDTAFLLDVVEEFLDFFGHDEGVLVLNVEVVAISILKFKIT